jgi:molecular chaperone GrpE
MTNEKPEVETEQPETELHVTDTDNAPLNETQLPDSGEVGETSIEALQERLASAEKRALLYQADLENFRRRKSRETRDALKYASLPLIESLLQVLDNLDRALDSAANEEESSSSLREGVELVRTQLLAALESQGCRKIEALGQVFDPNVHEAIQMQPAEEAANTIIMEVQTGYLLHDRVVRPARVIISTGPAQNQVR